jgi:hypothetical protein
MIHNPHYSVTSTNETDIISAVTHVTEPDKSNDKISFFKSVTLSTLCIFYNLLFTITLTSIKFPQVTNVTGMVLQNSLIEPLKKYKNRKSTIGLYMFLFSCSAYYSFDGIGIGLNKEKLTTIGKLIEFPHNRRYGITLKKKVSMFMFHIIYGITLVLSHIHNCL